LDVYSGDSRRVGEDYNLEVATSEGAYGRRQIFELIQNGADALIDAPGRIAVVLTDECLYVANQGAPLNAGGIHALMSARQDTKRGEEIGRFGLGFKSVVAISDKPQIFSAEVSMGFDRAWSAEMIREIVPGRQHYPLLRLAQPLDAGEHRKGDEVLDEL